MDAQYKAAIHVTLKASVLDPQGAAVTKALHALGYQDVQDVRVGKFIEVALAAADETSARDAVARMCEQLLTNPVIESYTYELTELTV
ncbi:MAG: phosphoribosylformylglycinamidine synthase subunit PurS [Firmicutes bacterium]|nr:phosphoribosylformylglycinamidine synthase subunit PurS [Bacillota bacterium]